MDNAQFLKIAKQFQETKERLDQLPGIIEKLMIEELNLRKKCHLNNDTELIKKINSVKKEREKLESELVDKKALLLVLRRQFMEISKETICIRLKLEEANIAKLKQESDIRRSMIDSAIKHVFRVATELWGHEAKDRLVSYFNRKIEEHYKEEEMPSEVGIEGALSKSIERKNELLKTLEMIQKGTFTVETSEKSKEDKLREWINVVINFKDPKNKLIR